MALRPDKMVGLTTSPAFTWWVKHVASRLDPLVFRASNGRFTSMGPAVVPMVTLTTIGRRSGKSHAVHLACLERADDFLVIASAMGQQKHPAWRYNLEAHPEVWVQARGARFRARARVLSDAEKEAVWEDLCAAFPQIPIYTQRTDRNIRVFSLTRCP